MKKIFKMMFAVVAGVAALTACTNEPEEGVTPTPEAQGFTVIASMDDATKATMSDEAGMAWEVGDQIAVRQYTLGGGSHEAVSNGLAAENIAADGKASFTFEHLINDNPAHFFYNLNGGAVWKSEFNFNPTMTQESAGVMNKSYLKLRSKEGVEIATTGANTIETKMNIVGTLARFIIYSSNEEYIGEKVKSVEMVSTTTNIAGLLGYDFTKGDYYYWQDDNATQSENPEIFYFGTKTISVSLTNPMEVNTRDAESSQGKTVYMPIPPVNVEGYKYVVTTDKATYTFDATDKTTKFNENELKNIKLNLNSATEMVLGVKQKTLYFFNGGIIGKEITVSSAAAEDINLGYLVAQPEGTDMRDYTQYPELVCVSVEDYNNGDFSNPVDWMSAHLQTNANGDITDCVWYLDVMENTSDVAREGVIVQDWSASGLYVGENLTPAVFVKQDIAGAAKKLTFNPGVGDKSITCDAQSWDHGYFVIFSNGTQLEANMVNIEEAQLLYDCIEIIPHDMSTGLGAGAPAAKWITLAYDKNDEGKFQRAWIEATAEKNTEATQRQVLVGIYMTPPAGYAFDDGSTERRMLRQFIITQEAYKASIAATLNNVYDGTVGYEGNEITVGTLALTADGEAVADANEFCNVAINGGASVVLAANGTITATIPANTSSSAKKYTVAIKDKSGNALVDNVIINQDANPEGGGEVVEGPQVTDWTWASNTNHNTGMPNNTTGLSGAVYYEMTSVTIDGTTYTGTEQIATLETEQLNAITAKVFEFAEYTTEETASNVTIHSIAEQKEMFELVPWISGHRVAWWPKFNTLNSDPNGARRYVKIVCYNADGSVNSTSFFHQDPA